MIRVILLCDDHALIRRGIRDTLVRRPRHRGGRRGEATYPELRTLLRNHTWYDVLVLDINMPGRS